MNFNSVKQFNAAISPYAVPLFSVNAAESNNALAAVLFMILAGYFLKIAIKTYSNK